MSELTTFCNTILEDNPQIVEYYTAIPSFQDKVNNFVETQDIKTLILLAHELKTIITRDSLSDFQRNNAINTLFAMLLAIKKLETISKAINYNKRRGI